MLHQRLEHADLHVSVEDSVETILIMQVDFLIFFFFKQRNELMVVQVCYLLK